MNPPSQTKIITLFEDSQYDADALERITRPKRKIEDNRIFEELPPVGYYDRDSRQSSKVIVILCICVLASLMLAFAIVSRL